MKKFISLVTCLFLFNCSQRLNLVSEEIDNHFDTNSDNESKEIDNHDLENEDNPEFISPTEMVELRKNVAWYVQDEYMQELMSEVYKDIFGYEMKFLINPEAQYNYIYWASDDKEKACHGNDGFHKRRRYENDLFKFKTYYIGICIPDNKTPQDFNRGLLKLILFHEFAHNLEVKHIPRDKKLSILNGTIRPSTIIDFEKNKIKDGFVEDAVIDIWRVSSVNLRAKPKYIYNPILDSINIGDRTESLIYEKRY